MIDTRVVSTSLQNVEMKNEANQDLAQDEKAIFKSSNNFNSRGVIARTSAQSTLDKSLESHSKTQSVASKKDEKMTDPNEVIIEERESMENSQPVH